MVRVPCVRMRRVRDHRRPMPLMRRLRVGRIRAGAIRGVILGYFGSRLPRRRVWRGRGAVIGAVVTMGSMRVVIVP